MKLYSYAEHTTRAGEVFKADYPTDDDTELRNDHAHDVDLWGEGSPEELVAAARERLAVRYDKRPGGAGDDFAWRAARNVLRHFGEPIDADAKNEDED